MSDGDRLAIDLDPWDDSVAVFAPEKVLRRVQQAFPGVVIDPTDHQQVRLERELAFWEQTPPDEAARATFRRQSWGLYQANGPMYRFAIPFASGHEVRGQVRRYCLLFHVPAGLPPEHREAVLAFLRSLGIGEVAVGTDE